MGLEGDTVELLTEVLQLHYRDGALCFYRDAEVSVFKSAFWEVWSSDSDCVTA